MKPGERVVLRDTQNSPVGEILSVGVQTGDLGEALNESTLVTVYWGTFDNGPIVKTHPLSALDLGPMRPMPAEGEEDLYVPAYVRLGYAAVA